jgi:MazG family protein
MSDSGSTGGEATGGRDHARLFVDLFAIATRLRGEGGCPWDREQTLDSLTPYVLEEAHEVAEAVADGRASGAGPDASPPALLGELGDLLFLILMMVRIAEERGDFRMEDLLAASADKMRRRHPHVFGDVRADDSTQVRRNWEAIKRAEGGDGRESVLDGVPKGLSPLLRARRIQEKAASTGFDWTVADEVVAKIEEEVREIRAGLATGDGAGDELGDLLFAAVNLSRFLNVNPDDAVRRATERFRARFAFVERAIAEAARPLSLAEMERAWEAAKAAERGDAGP